jgi:adenosylcobinamide-GDP ribazoletransferase
MAVSTFTKIPMPRQDWDRANMKYTLAALPFVGVLTGIFIYIWALAADALGFGAILFSAGLTLIPVILTGGIHLDGFCDTMDAINSRAAPERKREILKDPRIGAFAAIWLGVYLTAYFALCSEFTPDVTVAFKLGATAVISRAAAGIAIAALPRSSEGGLADTLRGDSREATLFVCILWLIWAGVFAWGAAVASIICILWVRRMSKRDFGGMSGDLAGYLISICELFGIMTVIINDKAGLTWF